MFSLAHYKPQLASRYVGFDRFFDDVHNFLSTTGSRSFPPYDIEQTEDGSTIVMAVAGYAKEDIKVTYNKSNHVLSIVGSKSAEAKSSAHKVFSAIASRNFSSNFVAADGMEPESVTLENGILTIKLKRTVTPEQEVVLEIK